MTGGRTKTPRVEIVEANVDLQALDVTRTAVSTVASAERIAEAYSEDRDEFNQMFAEMRLADSYEGFSRTVRISRLKKINENKEYRFLKGRKNPHGAEFLTGTWEEFCRLIGKSVDQADRDIANFKAFGEQALEAMTNAGIGYRELRQFRKLPEDQRAALIQVAQSGDKAEATATLQAKDQLLAGSWARSASFQICRRRQISPRTLILKPSSL